MKLKAFGSLAILFVVSAALAQAPASDETPKPEQPTAKSALTKPVEPPAVPDALKIELFKAQSDLNAAQLNLEHAQQTKDKTFAVFQKALEDAKTFCGEKFNIEGDRDGYPVCAVKATTHLPSVSK